MPCGVGGGTHRSWPGGRGSRPRALIPGEEFRAWQAKAEHPATELAWWTGGQGGGARARGGVQGLRFRGSKFRNVCRIFVVSNRTKRRKMAFLKDALWGGGGTHRSWPGGRGGRRALIPGEGVREGLAWPWWTGGQGGARARGGCRGFGSGGVGGRGTGPRDGANFATCVVFLLFHKKKNGFI